MPITWDELSTEDILFLIDNVPAPLAVLSGVKQAQKEAEKLLGSDDPAEWEGREAFRSSSRRSPQEIRGDGGGHAFHGNQYTGGKGGGGYSSMAVLGNVVVPAGGPTTAKEYAKALRDKGYTGPLSYPKGKLKEIYDVHVGSAPKGTPGTTTSVNVGHASGTGTMKVTGPVKPAAEMGSTTGGYVKTSLTGDLANQPSGTVKVTKDGTAWEKNPGNGFKKLGPEHPLTGSEPGIYKKGGADTPAASKVAASHAGVEYEHKTAVVAKNQVTGTIWVKADGSVHYINNGIATPAGPGTTAAFKGKEPGSYVPVGGTIKGTGAKVPNASGSHLPGGTPITTSVKTLAHEVDAVKSHEIGERNWKEGFLKQSSAAIKSYSGSYSGSINGSMQQGAPNAMAQSMHKYISTKGHQLDDKITVDRGIGGTHATNLKNLSAGATIEYKSFASTTYAQVGTAHHSVAAGFGGSGVVMRITVPKGTRVGIGTHGATHHTTQGPKPGGEKEIILQPGKFKITHISENVAFNPGSSFGGTIIHMEYLA